MKKLFLLTITSLITSISFSQLELIKEETPPYNDRKQIAYLSNSKTILFEIKDNYLNLYKENLDLYKKIKLPARIDSLKYSNFFYNIEQIGISNKYDDFQGDKSFLITDKFFNSDEKIEFIISIIEYIDLNNTDRSQSIFILNEDGVTLHTFPNIKLGDPNRVNLTFSSINKSFVVKYTKNSGLNPDIKKEYYKVNGLIPCECNCTANTTPANLQKLTESKSLNLSTFPNPNTGKATITYELPENTTKGTIHLYSQQGELLKTYSVNNQQTELEISTEEYSSGTYFYELETNGYTSGGKKMIVIN
jgi:hypothetical protein